MIVHPNKVLPLNTQPKKVFFRKPKKHEKSMEFTVKTQSKKILANSKAKIWGSSTFNIRKLQLEDRKLSQKNFLKQESRFQNSKEKSFEVQKLHKKNFVCLQTSEENQLLFKKTEIGQQFKYLKRFYEKTSLLPTFNQMDFLFEPELKFQEEKTVEAFLKDKNQFVTISSIKEGDKKLHFSHPNLINVYGQVKIDNTNCIVTENASFGSLKTVAGKYPVPEKLVSKYAKELVEATLEFHRREISHNRINLQTVYTTNKGSIIVNQCAATSNKLTEEEKLCHFCFVSPQQLSGKINSLSNDIWAIGSLILLLATGNARSPLHPYFKKETEIEEKKEKQEVDRIGQILSKKKKKNKNEGMENQLSQQLLEFIKGCLKIKEEERQSINKLKQYNFLS